ncbi:MAG: branched-chain amino acid ABC transporter permease [Deltaproteobacteria bacterium]
MDPALLAAQFMSGLSRGMMLFLIASGLSLIFGVMNILNFAHASLWLVGAYLCYSFWTVLQGYGIGMWLSIVLAGFALAAIGWVIEVVLIRRVYERELPEQLLLTYAMVLIIGDLIKLVWGVDDKIIARPPVPRSWQAPCSSMAFPSIRPSFLWWPWGLPWP